MSQQMPTFKSSGAIAAIFGIKNNSQNILPFVTNNNPIPFDGSESLGGVPFCAPFDALPTPFEIVDGFYSGPVDALANALPISLVMEKVVETDMGFHMSNTPLYPSVILLRSSESYRSLVSCALLVIRQVLRVGLLKARSVRSAERHVSKREIAMQPLLDDLEFSQGYWR